jgi:hypothetical protein
MDEPILCTAMTAVVFRASGGHIRETDPSAEKLTGKRVEKVWVKEIHSFA